MNDFVQCVHFSITNKMKTKNTTLSKQLQTPIEKS